LEDILNQKTPQHIAIIMDGNGRWAENRALLRIEGHKSGLESVKTIIQCCLNNKVACLSLFAFSSENWSRPVDEVDFLMQLFLDALKQELEKMHSHGIRLCFTGDRQPLSKALQEQMQASEQLTEHNQVLILNIVVNYGGKWDIVSATKKIAAAVQSGQLLLADVNEANFSEYLDTAKLPEVDLFIRTSGELRLSNFFLWQLAYTELYFTEVLWPDFKEQAFEDALAAYSQRNRRFGRILPEAHDV
jgi:undecaprenyl diphosphate synthase